MFALYGCEIDIYILFIYILKQYHINEMHQIVNIKNNQDLKQFVYKYEKRNKN